MFLFKNKAKSIPKIGAIKYSHRISIFPETNAGPKLLAGFIDAPQIGPANQASRKTVKPIKNGANF